MSLFLGHKYSFVIPTMKAISCIQNGTYNSMFPLGQCFCLFEFRLCKEFGHTLSFFLSSPLVFSLFLIPICHTYLGPLHLPSIHMTIVHTSLLHSCSPSVYVTPIHMYLGSLHSCSYCKHDACTHHFSSSLRFTPIKGTIHLYYSLSLINSTK